MAEGVELPSNILCGGKRSPASSGVSGGNGTTFRQSPHRLSYPNAIYRIVKKTAEPRKHLELKISHARRRARPRTLMTSKFSKILFLSSWLDGRECNPGPAGRKCRQRLIISTSRYRATVPLGWQLLRACLDADIACVCLSDGRRCTARHAWRRSTAKPRELSRPPPTSSKRCATRCPEPATCSPTRKAKY